MITRTYRVDSIIVGLSHFILLLYACPSIRKNDVLHEIFLYYIELLEP